MLIAVNGTKLNVQTEGPDRAPWVTFINGITNDLTMWNGQAELLRKDFRVLRFDQRGHGGSEATFPPYTLDLLTGDVVGLWNELGIERSSLVGLGLGGSISIGVGIRYSDRLIRLVPCCCRAKMIPEIAAIWPTLLNTVEKNGIEAIVEPTVQRWFNDEFRAANPEVIKNMRRMIRATDPRGYFGCVAAFLQLDFLGSLDKIQAPTLFISGAEDRLGGPPQLMQGLAEAVLGAKHISVPAAAHICNLQNPAGFNAALSGFLKAG